MSEAEGGLVNKSIFTVQQHYHKQETTILNDIDSMILNLLHWSTKKTFKELQEVLQLIWTHGGSLITESSVNFHSYVQIFLNFDFLIFAFSPFFGPIFGPIFLLFLQKTSQISSSSRFGGFWGCWFHFWTKKSNYRSSWPIKVAQGHVTEVKSWKKGQGSSFSHKSLSDMFK